MDKLFIWAVVKTRNFNYEKDFFCFLDYSRGNNTGTGPAYKGPVEFSCWSYYRSSRPSAFRRRNLDWSRVEMARKKLCLCSGLLVKATQII